MKSTIAIMRLHATNRAPEFITGRAIATNAWHEDVRAFDKSARREMELLARSAAGAIRIAGEFVRNMALALCGSRGRAAARDRGMEREEASRVNGDIRFEKRLKTARPAWLPICFFGVRCMRFKRLEYYLARAREEMTARDVFLMNSPETRFCRRRS